MLTTIPPPIVLPKTNLLKIHPIPSSPSSANSMQREWEWEKRKSEEVRGDEYRNTKLFRSCSAEQLFILCHKMFTHIQWRAFSFSFLFFSGMHLLVICYGRFAAQWNPSRSGVIPLPPHWLPINEAISTNTFWRLWNHFWKGVFNDTSHKHASGQCL